ncbi:MAG: hypothetical protein HY909_17600 [Deltaproteobacteria bacterium]|nr:hypothetical protein [Deltaproteobacteria bacterium]
MGQRTSLRRGFLGVVLGAALTAIPGAAGAQVYYQGTVEAQPVYTTQTVVQPASYQVNTATWVRTGFFFRGGLGGGVGIHLVNTSSGDFRLTGPALLGEVAGGWTVADNFAVHGNVAFTGTFSPSAEYTTSGSTTTAAITARTITQALVGGGFTYYLMPFLGYISIVAGLAVVETSITTPGGVTSYGESLVGGGVNILAGKEWLLTQRWTLGVAGQVLYSRVPDRDGSAWNNLGFGLLATVTDY